MRESRRIGMEWLFRLFLQRRLRFNEGPIFAGGVLIMSNANEYKNEYNPSVCCYCGSREYRLVTGGPIIPVVACAECGLMRQGFRSGENVIPYVDYAGGCDRCMRQHDEMNNLHKYDYLKIMPQIEKFIPRKGRLLEIGCQCGDFLNEVQKLGWKVTGIDSWGDACEIARSRYGLDIIHSSFQEANIADASFDVVVLLNVIEHLLDPAEGFVQIARMIRPGGLLVLETPRYDTLSFKLLKGRERSVVMDHKYFFTRKTIQALATSKSQFEVLQLDSVGRTVTLDRLCFHAAKFLHSGRAGKALAGLSNALRLNKVHVHVNLHDMMRLYLRKIG